MLLRPFPCPPSCHSERSEESRGGSSPRVGSPERSRNEGARSSSRAHPRPGLARCARLGSRSRKQVAGSPLRWVIGPGYQTENNEILPDPGLLGYIGLLPSFGRPREFPYSMKTLPIMIFVGIVGAG